MSNEEKKAWAISKTQDAYEKFYEGKTDPTWKKQSLYYEYDTVYRFKYDGECFEYRIIADIPETDDIWVIQKSSHIKGIHYRPAKDDGTFKAWDDPLPVPDGTKVDDIVYRLNDYRYISYSAVEEYYYYVASGHEYDLRETGDYNCDQIMDQADIDLMIEYSMANPILLTPYGLTAQVRDKFIENMFFDQEAVLMFGMEYFPYMNVWSNDHNDPWMGSNYELLPLNYLNKMDGDPMNNLVKPEDADFIVVCFDAYFEGEPYWAYYNSKDENSFVKFNKVPFAAAVIINDQYTDCFQYNM